MTKVLSPWSKNQLMPEDGRLADTLNLTGLARFRLLILPRIRRPLGFSGGLAAALSMGDLGVIALFADPNTATLPLQVYRLMGAYRIEDAGGASVLLSCLVSFADIDHRLVNDGHGGELHELRALMWFERSIQSQHPVDFVAHHASNSGANVSACFG